MLARSRRAIVGAVCIVSFAAAGIAQAEPDTFLLGSGAQGPVTVNGSTVLNAYAPVTSGASLGASTIAIGAVRGMGGFAAGDLVMLHVAAVPSAATSSQLSPPPFDLSTSSLGRYELARVASVVGSSITLTKPLVRRYDAGAVVQVIRVVEATSVTFASGASLNASAWDGSCGGVVAVLATGVVHLGTSGSIQVADAGRRPGIAGEDNAGLGSGCTALDGPAPVYGQKGEGEAPATYGGGGYGTFGGGGGGGNCLNAGGGGGAGAGGNGGVGGNAYANDTSHDECSGPAPCVTGSSVAGTVARAVGGRGGVSAVNATADRLLFGAGGGAGQGDGTSSDGLATSGGRGGGAIFLRAGALAGTGTVFGSGTSACAVHVSSAPASCFLAADAYDGGGGGGGGGTVIVRTAANLGCPSVQFLANGGSGGVALFGAGSVGGGGSGGGGGGGLVTLQSADATSCVRSANGGGAVGPARGQSPGTAGTVRTRTNALAAPAAPTIDAIASGSRRPTLSGSTSPGVEVIAYLDGGEWGRASADGSGHFDLMTNEVPSGEHRFTVTASIDGVESAPSSAMGFGLTTCALDADCAAAGRRCTPSGICAECLADGDCAAAAAGARCSSALTCGCATGSDCPSETPVCSGGVCRGCTVSAECGAPHPVCSAAGACVACDAGAPGACGGATPFCRVQDRSCVACKVDAHCAADPRGARCDGVTCGCQTSDDCALGHRCDGGRCVEGCDDSSFCDEGLVCSDAGACEVAPLPVVRPGCAATPGDGSWLAMLFVLALLRRRRRRLFA